MPEVERDGADFAIPTAKQLGDAFAAMLAGDWQLDDPEQLFAATGEAVEEALPLEAEPIPLAEEVVLPTAEAVVDADIPPSPVQIIEALLFVGGNPLTAARACAIVRGMSEVQFHEWVDLLNRIYRSQNRPYYITTGKEQGYVLAIRQQFRGVKERLHGGPRETRLTQTALDVLALIAYRQPIGRGELDTIRGADSASTIRQLQRLGLVMVAHRGVTDQPETAYGTTPRFLELFGLKSLEDLPQFAEAHPV